MDTVLTLIYLWKRHLQLAHINLRAQITLHRNHKSAKVKLERPLGSKRIRYEDPTATDGDQDREWRGRTSVLGRTL
jgi:hypothetical protein